ncbi:YjcQ family protein [Paratractidigestivibacter sp.]|uniref:YjcQ family protein n=1 Tax=Paratractidigestivibacter sp. TaxID=2847316 RepID=UPI002AC9BDA0|nr:YjcQ family protein [Paratractidigestivibacter sp.]
MAQDDMFVVMYKILAYIYDCNRRGVPPLSAEWNHEALGVPYLYWVQVVEELAAKGYIAGVRVTHTKMGDAVFADRPRVTADGVQFAQENTRMAKVRDFLREAKATIPMI